MVANNIYAAEPAKLWPKTKLSAEDYELDAEAGPRSIMSVYECALIPAPVAGYFSEKALKLAKGFEVDPAPGQRVYAFLGAVFLTNPNRPRKRAR